MVSELAALNSALSCGSLHLPCVRAGDTCTIHVSPAVVLRARTDIKLPGMNAVRVLVLAPEQDHDAWNADESRRGRHRCDVVA